MKREVEDEDLYDRMTARQRAEWDSAEARFKFLYYMRPMP